MFPIFIARITTILPVLYKVIVRIKCNVTYCKCNIKWVVSHVAPNTMPAGHINLKIVLFIYDDKYLRLKPFQFQHMGLYHHHYIFLIKILSWNSCQIHYLKWGELTYWKTIACIYSHHGHSRNSSTHPTKALSTWLCCSVGDSGYSICLW
jgi:hypothetical protein